MTNKKQSQVDVQGPATVEPAGNGGTGVERASTRHVHTPATDILESNDDYMLTVDLPGADPSSLDVTYENDVLTIRASTISREDEGFALAHSEFEFGDYQRAFAISEKVDADAIQADLKNGVLTIRLPKAKPARRKVSVSAG